MTRLSSARIRRLVLVTLAAILIVPTAIVLGVELLGDSERAAIARATRAAAHAAARTDDRADPRTGDRAELRAIAARHAVRLWLVDPATRETLFDSDHQPRARSDLGVGSLGIQPGLADAFDDRRARPADREHAVVAAELGQSAGCATFQAERLLVCEAAMRTAAGNVVLAQRAAPRVASRLVDAREGLLLLAGGVLFVGAGLAAWLVRRLAHPLAALHRQVAARTRGEQTSIAIHGAPREIVDVARAVDDLAGRLEDHNRRQAIAAADLAHELKGPLARIRIALEARGLDEAARTALDGHATTAIVEIDRVVAELLEIARAEAGLAEEPRSPTDLHALAARVVADRGPLPPRRVELRGTPVLAEVAAGPVARALGHLLDNASAHATSTIAVAVEQDGDQACLTVTDDGPGVPAELRPRLFERFASRRPGGTGLGLAYVRAVAVAHAGSAALVERDGGAAFVLRLPAFTPRSHRLHPRSTPR